MSINKTECFYFDVIIITLQNDVFQQKDVGDYINPNTEIALEWEKLASHFSFATVNADAGPVKRMFVTVKSALTVANEK